MVVIGVGADGWAGLSAPVRARVAAADVVLGGERHLAAVPSREGQLREPWPRPLRDGLPALLERHADRSVVALASGDPLVSGIGSTLLRLLGPAAVEVVPAVSSIALARARMGWPAESCAVVSLVGRDAHALLREAVPGRRVLVLSADERTPGEVAALLDSVGLGDARLHVLGDLGGAAESRVDGVASSWAVDPADLPRLHVLALEVAGGPPVPLGWTAGLPDEAYEHDGQLTKRDLRASALARLAPRPGEVLWDVGAGAGSVGIEWMRAHPACRTVAVEQHPERAARVARNAARLGVPALEVVTGRAPESLAGLPAPDAVFVGGGATAPGVLEACRAALRPGGRLVVHGVTLETESLLAAQRAAHGGELTRVAVETASAIGGFTGWTPARAVVQWAWTAPPSVSQGGADR
nr:precorrin-6y C5,15-methyltransferase (decarboxylating) subunit CbiE [Nocardioides perillae]